MPVNPDAFTEEEAERIAEKCYGLASRAEPLPSYQDQNFRLVTETGRRYVLKISHPGSAREQLDFENKAMQYLAAHHAPEYYPRPLASAKGHEIETLTSRQTEFPLRLLTYVPGIPMAKVGLQSKKLLQNLGRFVAAMDRALQFFIHPAMSRNSNWDLKQAAFLKPYTSAITQPDQRALLAHFYKLHQIRALPLFHQLRSSVIHCDANEYNVLIDNEAAPDRIRGIIDFGDMVHSYTVCDLAIAVAYALLGKEDPWSAAIAVVSGYHEVLPLTRAELGVLFPLMAMRLYTSVVFSAHHQKLDPENRYISISAKPAWRALTQLAEWDADQFEAALLDGCGISPESRGKQRGPSTMTAAEILKLRGNYLSKALSLSYRSPLKIVRGEGAYLFDDRGRPYLDLVNNVCHVGHAHPRVVAAGQRQMARLNTNTRYLHPHVVAYARRLGELLPDPLRICFFVCTGSEANELALRLARAHSGGRDLIVVDGAYHGNTSALVEMSPYKFDGPGGAGPADHVHKVVMPDTYRGPHRATDHNPRSLYANHVAEAVAQIRDRGQRPAAFFCESLLGCGGQIELPPGYLRHTFDFVRKAGGVCVADEVQVGFGRVGSHFWGFQTQGVTPDIVTLGKPMGNGHPLAAVVTTPEIAASFENGMEYFNTFGGNPVSCAIGLAVLDVIEAEDLQMNADRVGRRLKAGLSRLMARHPLIGDVRGRGLFLGAELVRDRDTREPAGTEAAEIAERMKERGILISTDGPYHNVLKIKPPLVIKPGEADRVVETLDAILDEMRL